MPTVVNGAVGGQIATIFTTIAMMLLSDDSAPAAVLWAQDMGMMSRTPT